MKRFSDLKADEKIPSSKTASDLALEDTRFAHTVKTVSGFTVTSSAHSENTVLTVSTGDLILPERKQTAKQVCSSLICELMSAKKVRSIAPVTVICLGNSSIEADAIGSLCAKRIYATRHLKAEAPTLFAALGGREISVISTGVTAETGICALEIAKWCKKDLLASLIITVDALKAAKSENLLSVIQISSGVSPGSGTDSARPEISEKTVGVPVISIGVPTVISPQTILRDAEKSRLIAPATRQNANLSHLPSPKITPDLLTRADCSSTISTYAEVISNAINSALIGDFTDQRKE